MQLIRTIEDLKQLDMSKTRPRLSPTGVLMCTPEHFNVVDVKNYFMNGQIGLVDRQKAVRQWQELQNTFERRGS